MWRSVRQTPHARTRTSTCPGSGLGAGSSVARSGLPGASRIERAHLAPSSRPGSRTATPDLIVVSSAPVTRVQAYGGTAAEQVDPSAGRRPSGNDRCCARDRRAGAECPEPERLRALGDQPVVPAPGRLDLRLHGREGRQAVARRRPRDEHDEGHPGSRAAPRSATGCSSPASSRSARRTGTRRTRSAPSGTSVRTPPSSTPRDTSRAPRAPGSAGADGASAGVFMPAHPRVGQHFRQEYLKGQAEDHFQVAEPRGDGEVRRR